MDEAGDGHARCREEEAVGPASPRKRAKAHDTMTTSRQLRLAGASAALAAIVVTVASCRAGDRAGDVGARPRERGGELTRGQSVMHASRP